MPIRESHRPNARVFAALAVLACWASAALAQQQPDLHFDTRIARPAFAGHHPRLVIDQAHHNFHTASGRYRPFADLMRHDGFDVREGRAAFTAASLESVDVLVIANALGHDDMSNPAAMRPAFTALECVAVRDWVDAGGALLLIADHAPMGAAARALGDTLGVDMRSAYTLDGDQGEKDNESLIAYTAEHGLAVSHPIVRGRDTTERVHRVVAFTGQSLTGPPGSTQLMRLSDRAQDLMVAFGKAGGNVTPDQKQSAAGRAQGLAFELGKGRVVVLGEAAMMTAQVAGPERLPMGMNAPGNDDRQFAINVARWLARALN